MALTRTKQQKKDLSMPMAPEEAFASILAAFTGVGRVQTYDIQSGRISGSIGGGLANMNNANVTVEVRTNGESQSNVTITATAQEGLIPQNTAARVIARLLEAIP